MRVFLLESEQADLEEGPVEYSTDSKVSTTRKSTDRETFYQAGSFVPNSSTEVELNESKAKKWFKDLDANMKSSWKTHEWLKSSDLDELVIRVRIWSD